VGSCLECMPFCVANQWVIIKNSRIRRPLCIHVFRFIILKLVQAIVLLVAVSCITFFLLANAGGDAVSGMQDNPQVGAETIERMRRVYGLDRPASERYLDWLGSFVTGDMGESMHYRVGVRELVLGRLWKTMQLGGAALIIAWAAAPLLSFIAAVTKYRWVDRVIEATVLVTASIPRIVLALFALGLVVWSSGTAVHIREGSLASFLISALVMSVPLVSVFLAQSDAELKRAQNEDSIRLARAKGLGEMKVIGRHASRFTLNPLLTLLGLSLGGIVGGSVIVETILGWPGIGALMVTAVRARDVSLVMGIVVLASFAVWFGNTLAEVLQMINDKRLLNAEMRR